MTPRHGIIAVARSLGSVVRELLGLIGPRSSRVRRDPRTLLALPLLLPGCDGSTAPVQSGALVDAAPDHAAEASVSPLCTAIGATGSAPRCKVFAFCATGDYELDCNREDARCRCRTVTGKGRAEVDYAPAFCALPDGGDALETSEGLEAVFAAATAACEWPP